MSDDLYAALNHIEKLEKKNKEQELTILDIDMLLRRRNAGSIDSEYFLIHLNRFIDIYNDKEK